ncbi:MAG: peptidase C69 [Halobacteriovorax sp.]|nr:peptidase C69 [Halobacteriovorax sp.]
MSSTIQLLDKNIAKSVIDHGLSLGADFVELFIEKTQNQTIKILNSAVDDIGGGVDFGIGLRLVYGTKVLYGYTNNPSADELKKIATTLAVNDQQAAKNGPVNFINKPLSKVHKASLSLHSEHPLDAKIAWLMRLDQATRKVSEKIVQVVSSGMQKCQQVEIFNSEGLHIAEERNYIRLMGQAVAQDGSEQSSGYEAPGALRGWEYTEALNPTQLGEVIGRQAMTKLHADPCPAGRMPVIIDNAFGGVIFHEACGHLLETTSVAKKASVFHDKMDQMIANPCVSAVDDGTLDNEWGSISIDDEGMETQKTQLIKDGVLTSFMVDRIGSEKTGYARTGSGRRQSYRFAPASRMRNTFIEPGKNSLEEMIASVSKGIYCKKMGGGSVQPGTGEFNFNAQESYLIVDGKIERPLKSATLISTGPEVLKQISMVGNNFALAAGMCGSVSGAVPTTVGQPAIKVDDILVEGRQ